MGAVGLNQQEIATVAVRAAARSSTRGFAGASVLPFEVCVHAGRHTNRAWRCYHGLTAITLKGQAARTAPTTSCIKGSIVRMPVAVLPLACRTFTCRVSLRCTRVLTAEAARVVSWFIQIRVPYEHNAGVDGRIATLNRHSLWQSAWLAQELVVPGTPPATLPPAAR